MGGKGTGPQRRMCLIVIFILVLAGMRVEEFCADACSVCPDFGVVSIQRVSGEQTAVLYREDRPLSRSENLTALRSTPRFHAGMRPGQWMTSFLIPVALFLKLLIGERFLPICQACENQYQRRTLDYIHHTDGKKA